MMDNLFKKFNYPYTPLSMYYQMEEQQKEKQQVGQLDTAEKLASELMDEPNFYIAKWKWTPKNAGEIKLNKDDVIHLTERGEEWWKGRTLKDESGWFPANRVRVITDPIKLKEVTKLFKELADSSASLTALKMKERQKNNENIEKRSDLRDKDAEIYQLNQKIKQLEEQLLKMNLLGNRTIYINEKNLI